jgi:hypothetical protein
MTFCISLYSGLTVLSYLVHDATAKNSAVSKLQMLPLLGDCGLLWTLLLDHVSQRMDEAQSITTLFQHSQ